MAFGIKKEELRQWKSDVAAGKIAFLTHYWQDERFPGCHTVTKVGCSNLEKLVLWGKRYGLEKKMLHRDPNYPHFDLFGERQKMILQKEGIWDQITRFDL